MGCEVTLATHLYSLKKRKRKRQKRKKRKIPPAKKETNGLFYHSPHTVLIYTSRSGVCIERYFKH